MSYKVTISDGTVLEESIELVSFNVDPPKDNSYDMREHTIKSMNIIGKIGAGEKTVGLYQWALFPANNPECYKGIEVEQIHAEQVIRKVKFSMAFVVDYSESFSNKQGVGLFNLFIRQFIGEDINIDSDTPISQSASEASPPEQVDNEIIAMPVTKDTDVVPPSEIIEGRMSFTDRIAKQKEIKDNTDISSLDAEELKKMFTEEIEQSKKAFTKAIEVKERTQQEGCVASNGKVTVSGFSEKAKIPDDFTRVPLEAMFDYCKQIGHKLPPKMPKFLDNGREGSFFACHAEKQLSLLTDKPIGISKPMCPNCVEYFSKHAVHTKQIKITADPKKTRIFFPNGIIREI